MSENETQQAQAEASQAPAADELAEGEMESVAGGQTVLDDALETIRRITDLFS